MIDKKTVVETRDASRESICDGTKHNQLSAGLSAIREKLENSLINEISGKEYHRGKYAKYSNEICDVFEKFFNSSYFKTRLDYNLYWVCKYKEEPEYGNLLDIPNCEITLIIVFEELSSVMRDLNDLDRFNHVQNLLHNFSESDRSTKSFENTSEYVKDLELFSIELAKTMRKRFDIIVDTKSFNCSNFRFKYSNQTFRFTFKFVK